MGWLSGFWGGRPTGKVTSQDRAILDLKLQRDKIKQYQKRVAGVVARERELAREQLAKGNRQRALLLLRRAKFQDQQLGKTDEHLARLEELASSIEFALIQRDVLHGLQQGSDVLKEINAEMSLDKVERLMDESAEGIAYQQQVADLLANKITRAEEDDVQEELERLERDVMEPLESPAFPAAPKTKLAGAGELETEDANEEGEPILA